MIIRGIEKGDPIQTNCSKGDMDLFNNKTHPHFIVWGKNELFQPLLHH